MTNNEYYEMSKTHEEASRFAVDKSKHEAGSREYYDYLGSREYYDYIDQYMLDRGYVYISGLGWEPKPETTTEEVKEVEISSKNMWFVSVFDCALARGGREEGGWWYDTGSLVRTVRTFKGKNAENRAYAYSRKLNEKLQSRKFGPNEGKRDYSSVLSDGEFQAHVHEKMVPEGFPERKPRYE